MSSKKIWQYPEATSITNDDYILMDSNTETGSQCLKANKIGAVHITKTVTERKVYKASDDNANGFSEVTVAVPYTDVHYDKDDIVSFIGEDLPLKSVTAYIEPQQDLHGYDAPWVGGAGKNKLPYFTVEEKNGVRLTYDNGAVVLNGTASANAFFTLSNLNLPNNNYVFSANNTVANNGVHVTLREVGADSDFADLPMNDLDKYNTYQNVSIGRITLYVISGTQLTNFKLPLQIEVGSSKTDFEPYSNICPISGHTEVNVSDTSKNLVNWKWNTFNDGKMEIFLKGGTYTLSAESILTNGNAYIRGTKPSGEYVSREELGLIDWGVASTSGVYYGGGGQQTYTFNVPNGGAKIEFGKLNNNGTISAQLEFGSTATTYEPYNGHTYTIDLDGTRYGGTLDVVSGVLTVDRIKWTLTPTVSQIAGVSINDCLISIPSDKTPIDWNVTINKCMCNKLKVSNYSAQHDNHVHFPNASILALYLADEVGTTKQDWVDYLAQAQIDVSYIIATPLTIQLTPTAVKSLLGSNNVWADTGEIAVEWQTLYVTPTT